jgi:hypothetical protein
MAIMKEVPTIPAVVPCGSDSDDGDDGVLEAGGVGQSSCWAAAMAGAASLAALTAVAISCEEIASATANTFSQAEAKFGAEQARRDKAEEEWVRLKDELQAIRQKVELLGMNEIRAAASATEHLEAAEVEGDSSMEWAEGESSFSSGDDAESSGDYDAAAAAAAAAAEAPEGTSALNPSASSALNRGPAYLSEVVLMDWETMDRDPHLREQWLRPFQNYRSRSLKVLGVGDHLTIPWFSARLIVRLLSPPPPPSSSSSSSSSFSRWIFHASSVGRGPRRTPLALVKANTVKVSIILFLSRCVGDSLTLHL